MKPGALVSEFFPIGARRAADAPALSRQREIEANEPYPFVESEPS
jgi:hypothetical protein